MMKQDDAAIEKMVWRTRRNGGDVLSSAVGKRNYGTLAR